MREIWMVEAYILVKISTQKEVYGSARSVVEKLMMMKGVENAELLFGDYDAVVKLNAPKTHDIENLVIEEISMIEGIESTITLLCVDEEILE
jgi:DNA-binding Lrp family transcriptional regulator